MKNYRITVNGTAYDVAVEEMGGTPAPVAATPVPVAAAPAPVAAPVAPAAAPAPVAAPAPAASASQEEGSIVVSAPMPGKVISIKASVGAQVKKGEVVLILEAMKMENEIVAPEDGTVASINVSAGDAVEAGDTMITLN